MECRPLQGTQSSTEQSLSLCTEPPATGWSLWTPSKCQWMSLGSIFFHMEKCKNTFASCTLPDQVPFCQTAPWLPSVTQQPNVMGYWWGGSAPISIPPASPFDVVGQHHRTGGITFGAASYHCLQWSLLHPQPDLRQPMLQPVLQFNHTISWRCLWAWKRGCFLLFFFFPIKTHCLFPGRLPYISTVHYNEETCFLTTQLHTQFIWTVPWK